MEKTKRLLYIAIYLILYGQLFARYVGYGEWVKIGLDILVIVVAYRVPKTAHQGLLKELVGNTLPRVVLAFFIIGTFSAIIEFVSPITIIWGIRMPLRYILLLYAVVKLCDGEDVIRFRKILDKAFVWNTVFCLIQFYNGEISDFMGGIFLGNGLLANFLILMTFLYTADYLRKDRTLREYALRVTIIFAIAMFAEIKMLYFTIPVCVYATCVIIKRFNWTNVVLLLLGYFIFVPVMNEVLSLYYDKNYVEQTLSQEKNEDYLKNRYGFTKLSFNRNTCVEMCDKLILKDARHRLLGYGIGSGSSSSIFSTDIYKNFGTTTFYFYFTSSYVLVETGWIGYILFLSAYVLLLFRFYTHYKDSTDNPETMYWPAMGLLASIVTLLLIWYDAGPYTNYYLFFLFWGFAFVDIADKKAETFCSE